MIPNLIAMLTHTRMFQLNGPRIFDECLDLPLEHWGFKNMGLSRGEMKALVRAMKEAGKTTFLEVVTIGEAECMRGAQIAVEDALDPLMGTVFYDSVFQYLQKHTTKYFPFCGRIVGHPSILEGTPDEIAHDGFRLQMKGVDRLDLLAYKHSTSAEEIALKLNVHFHMSTPPPSRQHVDQKP